MSSPNSHVEATVKPSVPPRRQHLAQAKKQRDIVERRAIATLAPLFLNVVFRRRLERSEGYCPDGAKKSSAAESVMSRALERANIRRIQKESRALKTFSPALLEPNWTETGTATPKAAEGAADFGLQVDFRQLTLHVKGRTIIGGIDGRVARGRATAIMGSSGAGKTSLLNVLSGRASYGVGGGVRSDAHKGTTLVSLFESAARLGLS